MLEMALEACLNFALQRTCLPLSAARRYPCPLTHHGSNSADIDSSLSKGSVQEIGIPHTLRQPSSPPEEWRRLNTATKEQV